MPAREKLRPIARRALAAQSDERLVRLIREGHGPAFEEAVRRYQGPLLAFAAAIVPYHRAEDVVQAALQKAHSALLADAREINLRPWLFAIVRNGALNVIRDDPAWEEIDPNYDGVRQPPAVAEQNEDLQRLVTAICALPDAQREALVRREIEGDGHAEIAAALGTSRTAVRGLIFRARSALRDGLGAMIPLPVMRMLMVEAPAAAGVGAGGATIGGLALGTSAKTGIVVTTAALALGGGFVIDRKGSDDRVAEASPVQRERGQAPTESAGGGSGSAAPAGSPAAASGAAGNDGEATASSSPDRGPGPGPGEGTGDDRGAADDDGQQGPDDSGSSGSGDGDGDDGASGGGSGPGPGGADDPSEIDDDHSGPGGGGSGQDDPPDVDDDHSGSGGGGLDDELDDPLDDIEEPEDSSSGSDGNSGPGGADDDPAELGDVDPVHD